MNLHHQSRVRVSWLAAAIIVAMVIAVAAVDAAAQPLLSERTGRVVTPASRTYFGLFPGIAGYLTATFRDIDGDNLAADVHRGAADGGDTTIRMTRPEFRSLSRYVDSFEVVNCAVPADGPRPRLPGLMRSDHPAPSPSMPFQIELAQGGIVEGTLLYVDEAVVVIGPAAYDACRGDLASDVHVIRAVDILRIRDRRSLLHHFFAVFDMRIAGNDTIYRRSALEPLRAAAVYHPDPPPEVVRAIAGAAKPDSTAPPTVTVQRFDERHERGVLHLSLLYRLNGMVDRGGQDIPEWDGEPPRPRTIVAGYLADGVALPSIGLELDLLPVLRLGAWGTWTFRNSLPGAEYGGNAFDYSTVYGFSGMATLRWTPIVASRMKDLSHQRFDVSIGAGAAYRRLVQDDVSWYYDGSSLLARKVATTASTTTGTVASAGVAYFVMDGWSLNAEGRYAYFADPSLPARAGAPRDVARLSPWEILLGIGWHP